MVDQVQNWKYRMEQIIRNFKRFRICAYCGRITAWRWIWNIKLCLVHVYKDTYGEVLDDPIALEVCPTRWRRLIDGACPCTPPAIKIL